MKNAKVQGPEWGPKPVTVVWRKGPMCPPGQGGCGGCDNCGGKPK